MCVITRNTEETKNSIITLHKGVGRLESHHLNGGGGPTITNFNDPPRPLFEAPSGQSLLHNLILSEVIHTTKCHLQ